MNVLCILLRTPRAGMGKTRLRAALSDAAVDEFVQASVTDTLRWDTPGIDHVLIAYDGRISELAASAPLGCTLIAQPEADFGTRLAAGLDASFAHGATRAVIVGSDCPTLPAALLTQAFEELTDHPATLIPARDGGWIALGVRAPVRDILRTVRWSCETACADTVAALEHDGRVPLLLPSWYDVDEAEDLLLLAAELRSSATAARAPRTAAALQQWAPSAR